MTTTPASIQFLPYEVRVFETLPGTNAYLKQLCQSETVKEGTVVRAINQTNGRGQFDREWLSEPGKNLTLSLLLEPKSIALKEAFLISKAMALAVFHTVKFFTRGDCSIKWPNDILCGDQKIAGILIENSIQGDTIKQCIVGIGLNVNQMHFTGDFHPTSLQRVTGKGFDPEEVQEVLLHQIRKYYLELMRHNFKKLETDYFQYLHKVNSEQLFEIHNEKRLCRVDAVKEDGSIVLISEQNKETYRYGEARWLL